MPPIPMRALSPTERFYAIVEQRPCIASYLQRFGRTNCLPIRAEATP